MATPARFRRERPAHTGRSGGRHEGGRHEAGRPEDERAIGWLDLDNTDERDARLARDRVRAALARLARERAAHRRRRIAVLVLLLAAAALVAVDLVRAGVRPVHPPAARPTAAASATPPAASPGPDGPGALTFPMTGPGTWTYAAGTGPVLGRGGDLRRFQVAVENQAGQNPATFARAVDAILGDGRSWVASGQVRWQRVPKGAPSEFTILLATPGTSERVCATGGLYTDKFTNCRLPGKVVINMARWWRAVPGYGAPLAEYQAYALNHEVGHQLGHGHEACPGPGQPAPVMQQQTLGLRGCTAYGWPYRDGGRYAGAPIP